MWRSWARAVASWPVESLVFACSWTRSFWPSTCCTVASTTLAIYVLFLQDLLPQIAGHLISASFLSIPAAAMASKLILPESRQPETAGAVPPIDESAKHGNLMAALAGGSWDGMRLAAGIATLLIAVLGVVGILDLALNAR